MGCVIKQEDTSLLLYNIHAPNEDKPEFFNQVINEMVCENERFRLLGDFKVATDVHMDRKGKKKKIMINPRK